MNSKSRDNLLTIVTEILSILPFIWWGMEMVQVKDIYFPGSSLVKSALFLVSSIVILGVWYFLQIIIHEAGHMVAGLLTGYKFVSFRIGSFTIIKEQKKLVKKKFTLKGTAGQCLMCPPECKPEDLDDTWYLLGGGMANLLSASLGMYIYSMTNQAFTYYLCFLGGIMGIVLCIQNLLPMKTGGMVNDGYNIFLSGKDKKAKAAMYYTLLLNAKMSESGDISTISEDLLETVFTFPYRDLSNIYEANLYSLVGSLYLAKGDYEAAKECNEKLYHTEHVLGIFKKEAQCELLYHEIIGECREEEIKKLYDDKLKAYIRSAACYPSKKLLMYAYYAIYKRDEAQAVRELCDLKALQETCPIKMEVSIALKEAEGVKARLEKKETIL